MTPRSAPAEANPVPSDDHHGEQRAEHPPALSLGMGRRENGERHEERDDDTPDPWRPRFHGLIIGERRTTRNTESVYALG